MAFENLKKQVHESSTNFDSYVETFQSYTAITDEKLLIANKIIKLTNETNTCLDLGAGNGELTKTLARVFKSVIAVDKQEKHNNLLAQIPNCTSVLCDIEDFSSNSQFDMILLSYSVTGINPNMLKETLARLLELRTPNTGKLIAVSFEDNCPWDLFASEVYKLLGIERTGGTANHARMFKDAGRTANVVDTESSYMWGTNIQELARTMAFFFGYKIDQYLERIEEFSQILSKYTEPCDRKGITLRADHFFMELH